MPPRPQTHDFGRCQLVVELLDFAALPPSSSFRARYDQQFPLQLVAAYDAVKSAAISETGQPMNGTLSALKVGLVLAILSLISLLTRRMYTVMRTLEKARFSRQDFH